MDRALDVFLNFNGRLSRVPFVVSFVANLIIGFIVTFIWVAVPFDPTAFISYVEIFLILAFLLMFVWTTLAIVAKRLHDVGQSGWLISVLWLPLIFPIMVPTGEVSVVSWLASIAIVAALSLVPSMTGENRFG